MKPCSGHPCTRSGVCATRILRGTCSTVPRWSQPMCLFPPHPHPLTLSPRPLFLDYHRPRRPASWLGKLEACNPQTQETVLNIKTLRAQAQRIADVMASIKAHHSSPRRRDRRSSVSLRRTTIGSTTSSVRRVSQEAVGDLDLFSALVRPPGWLRDLVGVEGILFHLTLLLRSQ